MGFPVAQKAKNLPAMWEISVRSLGWEDPLEKGMATHSGILARRIPCTEEPDGLQSIRMQRIGHAQSNLACLAQTLNMKSTLLTYFKCTIQYC